VQAENREIIRSNFIGAEDGHIYFFYRPKALVAHDVDDVEQLLFVMHPFDSKYYRLIQLDSSKLPTESDHFNMVTGIVKKAAEKNTVILKELSEKSELVYGSSQVKKSACRPCGEGIYTIKMVNNQSHIIYAIEMPHLDGKIKKSLQINDEGDFTLGIYNPYYESHPENLLMEHQVTLPEEIKAKLKTERIVYNDTVTLLNYENIKIALFKNPVEKEDRVTQEVQSLVKNVKMADIFEDLKLQKEKFPITPFIKGDWA
jgi:hypothetical protein